MATKTEEPVTVHTSAFVRDLTAAVVRVLKRAGCDNLNGITKHPQFAADLVAEVEARVDWEEVQRRLESWERRPVEPLRMAKPLAELLERYPAPWRCAARGCDVELLDGRGVIVTTFPPEDLAYHDGLAAAVNSAAASEQADDPAEDDDGLAAQYRRRYKRRA